MNPDHYVVKWKKVGHLRTSFQRFDTWALANEFYLEKLEDVYVEWATLEPMTEYQYMIHLFRNDLWNKKG